MRFQVYQPRAGRFAICQTFPYIRCDSARSIYSPPVFRFVLLTQPTELGRRAAGAITSQGNGGKDACAVIVTLNGSWNCPTFSQVFFTL